MSYRNKIKKKSVYIYHEFANILKNKNDSNPPQPQNFLHQLMLGLFYPAILGGIFFNLLDNYHRLFVKKENIDFMDFIIIIIFLIHYSLDYIQSNTSPKYNFITFIFDLLIIILLFFAFNSTYQSTYIFTFIFFGISYTIFTLYDFSIYGKSKYFSWLFAILFFVGCLHPKGWLLLLMLIASIIRLLLVIKDDLNSLKK